MFMAVSRWIVEPLFVDTSTNGCASGSPEGENNESQTNKIHSAGCCRNDAACLTGRINSGRGAARLMPPRAILRVSPLTRVERRRMAGSVRGQLSADGRYVVFVSGATNLIPNDTNNAEDVFVKDRQTGATTRVSVASQTGAQANNGSGAAAISGDGRYVAFYSDASNLVSGDTNGVGDIFVHDRQTGLTTRVSVDSSGHEANGENSDSYLAISGDGRYVAFSSEATNLVSGDTNNVRDIFVHDRQTSQTRRVSVASNGAEANGGSGAVDISDDGRYVAFSSSATNLVAGDTNGKGISSCTTSRQEVQPASRSIRAESRRTGAEAARPSQGMGATLYSYLIQVILIPEPMNIEAKTLSTCMTARSDRPRSPRCYSDGGIMTVGLFDQPTISRDGRYVAFSFYDKGDNNGIMNIWVRDLQMGTSITVNRWQ